MIRPDVTRVCRTISTTVVLVGITAAAARAQAPKVVSISLDGANPTLVEQYLKDGVLDKDVGLGRLRARGVSADQNSRPPRLLPPCRAFAIATGARRLTTIFPANTFHPVAATIGRASADLVPRSADTKSARSAPLESHRRASVAADSPGGREGRHGDLAGRRRCRHQNRWHTVVQAAIPIRTTDYTVPFGAFGGLGAQGFALTAANFGPATSQLAAELPRRVIRRSAPFRSRTRLWKSFSALRRRARLRDRQRSGRTTRYDILAAALDTTNDGSVNYDTLAFFDSTTGIPPGPIVLPSTGPAYAKRGGPSAPLLLREFRKQGWRRLFRQRS